MCYTHAQTLTGAGEDPLPGTAVEEKTIKGASTSNSSLTSTGNRRPRHRVPRAWRPPVTFDCVCPVFTVSDFCISWADPSSKYSAVHGPANHRSQGSASMHVPGLSWASTRHLTWDQCTYPSARTLTWHWTDGRVQRSISAKFQRHWLLQPLPTVQSTDIAVLYYITPISDR